MGNDVTRAINPVRMPDGDLKKNYINLDFNNFNISEVGDLKDYVDSLVDVSLSEEEVLSDLGI